MKTDVMPAHQTSDMLCYMISPESRSKLEMVILSSLRFLTKYLNFSCVQISININ